MRIAGTARGVNPLTVVAPRYQVEWAANSAKAGYRLASICPSRSINVPTGNSSKTTSTTGVWDRILIAAAFASLCGSTSSETSLKSRNTASTTAGAGISTSATPRRKRVRA